MATITATSITGSGDKVVTVTTLTASDTFTYNSTKNSILVLNNVTAGALTVNIVGDEATTVNIKGIGSIDISAGFSTSEIAIGATVAIPLDTISGYLGGVIEVTGGTGIEAQLLEF